MLRLTSALVLALFLSVGPGSAQTPPASAAEALPVTADLSDAEEDDRLPATGASKLSTVAPPYPKDVQTALDLAGEECRAQGGTAVVYGPGTVRTGDLTGDGRPDFVIDYRAGRCPGYFGMFNGTGGWDLEILVATPRGGLTSVFAGRVRDYDISAGPRARTVTFQLHGSFCGGFGTDPCAKRRRISARPFAFRDR